MEQTLCRACDNLVFFKFKGEICYHYYCPFTQTKDPDLMGQMEICNKFVPKPQE